MAQLDERLSHLFSDEDSMKQILEMASAVMARKNGSSSPETPPRGAAKQENNDSGTSSELDLASILNVLGNGHTNAEQSSSQANTTAATDLTNMLPQLLQVFSGNASLLQGERVNLVRAIQPYMSQNRVGNIDRAMRMANLTKAALDVLKLLGR